MVLHERLLASLNCGLGPVVDLKDFLVFWANLKIVMLIGGCKCGQCGATYYESKQAEQNLPDAAMASSSCFPNAVLHAISPRMANLA